MDSRRVCVCVFRERPSKPAEESSSKAVKTQTNFVLQGRTDLQGSIKFHIMLHENISRKWWQSNYESAPVKGQWDYHFTRGVGFFLKYTGGKSTVQSLTPSSRGRSFIMGPKGKNVASLFLILLYGSYNSIIKDNDNNSFSYLVVDNMTLWVNKSLYSCQEVVYDNWGILNTQIYQKSTSDSLICFHFVSYLN